MQGHIPKIPDFLANRNRKIKIQTNLAHELALPMQSAMQSTMQGSKRTSDRNRGSPSYYGFDNSFSESTIAASPKRSRRAGDVEKVQPTPASVVETVHNIAVQQPEEINNSPIIGEVSPPAPRVQPIIDEDIPTLVRLMTVLEAENQEISELLISQPKLRKL